MNKVGGSIAIYWLNYVVAKEQRTFSVFKHKRNRNLQYTLKHGMYRFRYPVE